MNGSKKTKMIISLLTVLVIAVFLLGSAGCAGKQSGSSNNQTAALKGTISLSGAWALYPMAVKWAEEFKKINPGVQIDVSAGGAGKGMADALGDIVDIGMVSRAVSQEEIDKGAWFVAVTKDAVVPVINLNNPLLDDLKSQGVKKETLASIWINGSVKSWKDVVNSTASVSENTDIHVYTRSDSCGAGEVWAKFLGGKAQEDLLGTGIYGDPGILEAVKNDNLGLGYNNINYAYDAKTKKPVEGTTVLPLDINGNGQLDEDENFYDTLEDIVEAIKTDKYPSPPARDLYFVCNGKPDSEVVTALIKWVLSDGQKFVSESGYINLPEEKIKEEYAKISGQ